MRAEVQRFAWRMWRGEAGWPGRIVGGLLLPAEGLWRLATRWRNRRWDRRGGVEVEGLAVVSVGNLAVGGTGKTPFSAWVAGTLAASGASPAVLLRGYGDDEVCLHRSWHPDIAVVVGADRVAGAERARTGGADVAVLDDGFQHRRLARRLDIVLLAAEDPVPAPILPRGPYREPLGALRRADVVVVTRRGVGREVSERVVARLLSHGLVRDDVLTGGVRFVPWTMVPLREHLGVVPDAPEPLAPPELVAPLVLTAVARPEELRRDVQAVSRGSVGLLAFPDHHGFNADDVRRASALAGDRPIVVTEKDAVKLDPWVDELEGAWVLLQRMAWDWGEDAVTRRIATVRDASAEASR